MDTQDVSTVQARCNSIPFDMTLNVIDMYTGEQTLVETNKMFNICDKDVSAEPVSILSLLKQPQNNYEIEWIYKTSIPTEEGWYLYQGANGILTCINVLADGSEKYYAIQSFYVQRANSSKSNQFVQNPLYPTAHLEETVMGITPNVIGEVVEYTNYIEVDTANRYFNFYFNLSPVVEMEFSETAEYDDNAPQINKGTRSVLVGAPNLQGKTEYTAIQTGEEGQALSDGAYRGYIGQTINLRFTADNKYYQSAEIIYHYTYIDENGETQETYEIKSIGVNQVINYTIPGEPTQGFVVKLIPRQYNLKGSVEYEGTTYVFAGATAEGEVESAPCLDAVVGHGTECNCIICSIKTWQEVSLFSKFMLETTSMISAYLYGDTATLTYRLNTAEISNFGKYFVVTLYVNGTKQTWPTGTTEYKKTATFTTADIEFKVVVEPQVDQVQIETNKLDSIPAELIGKVNSGEKVYIESKTETTLTNTFDLIYGDTLTIYIRPHVGYKFAGTYTYGADTREVIYTPVTEQGYEEYISITLFKTGFSLEEIGIYTLNFIDIPIEVEFKYYAQAEDMQEDTSSGADYTVEYEEDKIMSTSKVTIHKGIDTAGYRFLQYTYNKPLGEEGYQEFVLTEEGEDYSFNVSEDNLLTYLDNLHMQYVYNVSYTSLPLTIYVNYIRQYRITSIRDSELVELSLKTAESELEEYVYYDYGTEFEIEATTKMPDHYKLLTQVTMGGEEVDLTSATQTHSTKNGNMSGYTISQALSGDCVIYANAQAEIYDILLKEEIDGTTNEYMLKDQIGEFNEVETIWYTVTGTFEYGTKVTLRIHVGKARDKGKDYYALDKVKDREGNEVSYVTEDAGESDYMTYIITYEVQDKDMSITVSYNTGHWVYFMLG